MTRSEPLRAGVIADMGMVAQEFDRLEMGIEKRGTRGEGVDEHGFSAAFEHPARLPQPGLEVAPVMGGEPGGDEISTDERIRCPSECPCKMASALPSGDIFADHSPPAKICEGWPLAGLIAQTSPPAARNT